MAFCPTCKRNHDPDINCLDGTRQVLRDMGIEKPENVPKEEFKKTGKSANKALLLLTLAIIVGILLFLFFRK